MKPAHFLNLRWRQDYRFVTELRGRGVGPVEQVGLRLQQTKPDPWALYEESLAGVGDVITLFGRKFLEFDGRRAVWQHSLIYPLGTLDRAAARGIFRAAYGGDPGLLLPVLYELLAPLEHWEGDPLARRMFIGATTTPPEPIAATLIRELWSSRLPPGPERAAQLDALKSLLVGAGAPGVLDRPTVEEREALSTGRIVIEPAESDSSASVLPPFLPVEPAQEVVAVEDAGARSPGLGERETELRAFQRGSAESGAAEASVADLQESGLEAEMADAAEPAPVALQDPAPWREAPLAERAVADRVGSAGPGHADWSTSARGSSSFFRDIFAAPTEELLPIVEAPAPAQPSAPPDAPSVHGLAADEVSPPTQSAVKADVDDVEPLDLDDGDEEDELTVYAPLTGAQPVASGLGEAVTLLKLPPGDALGEAETFIHLPVSGAPPLVPSDAPPPAPLNAPGARGEAEEMKRPMMIGGMLGLVTALLALWIVWARSTPQDETLGGAGAPALGEQAAKPPAAPKPPTAGEGAANDAVAEGEPPKGAIAAGVDCYPDDDGDGFGRKGARPERYAGSVCPKRTAPKEGDCGDTDSSVKPGAKELCDGVDNDCSGERDDSKQYRDDNSDGKKDCGQSGPDSKSRVAVAYSWDKGTKQDEYLRITVAPPAGWKCKNHLVFSGDVQGRSLKRTFSAPSQTLICGIGFEGARLPNSIPPCVEGMTIAAKADSVAVEASCCIQNSGSYQRFKGSGDLDDMESCEYLRTSEVIRVKPTAALNTPPKPPPGPKPDGVSPP